jgi:hypothetical protein
MIRSILVSGLLLSMTTAAFAQLSGTPEEQAACRPDVRRFCYKLRPEEGSNAFMQCLQAHRVRLTRPCRTVLERHGA